MRWLRRIAIALGVLYVLWAVAFFFLQKPFFFPEYLAREKPLQQQRPPGVELWKLRTSDGEVEAWYSPPLQVLDLQGLPAVAQGTSVVFAHGNGELITHQADLLALYRRAGVHLLLVEFRGYGASAGEPSEEAIVEDFVQAFDLLIQQPGVDPKRVYFQGRSMGAAVVAALSAKRRPAGLILESGFTSLKGFYPQLGLPPFLARDPFDSLKHLSTYHGPALVIHGRRDTLIPYEHGVRLAKALSTELILFDAGHNDIPHESRYWSSVFSLLTSQHAR